MRDVSETSGVRDGGLSSTCMADGSSGAGFGDTVVDTAERSELRCDED